MLTREELVKRNRDRFLGQICYVSYDYMETIRYMTEKLEIGPWTLLSISDKTARNIHWEGKPVDVPFKYYIGITRVGNMELEVIQPGYGPNPYDKFLKEKGPGLHHIKLGIRDNEALRAEAEYLAERVGREVLYKGIYGLDHHYYVDTYPELGSFVELGNFADMPTPPEFISYYPE